MATQRVDRVLQRVTELPFSPVAGKILELARDERVGAREIAKVIAQDQAFTARLLKVANSPYYGQTRPVTTVSQAVPVLGIDTITSLALALCSFNSQSQDDSPILTMSELWEHSSGCAIWGRQLAKRVGRVSSEEAFIAGLLHDMGKALFHRFFKNEFLEAVQLSETQGIALTEAEESILGTDHAAAGAAVARKWNLPRILRAAIGYHHTPLTLPDSEDDALRKTVAIVHVADMLADADNIGRGVERDPTTIDDEVWDFLGIGPAVCDELRENVLVEVNEFRRTFDIVPRVKKKTAPRAPARESSGGVIPAAATSITATVADFERFVDAGQRLALLAGLDELLPNIAQQAMGLLHADAAHVFIAEDEQLRVAASAGMSQLKGKLTSMAGSHSGWVAKEGETLVLPNIEKSFDSWEKRLFLAAGFRAHIFVPVDWAGKRLAVLAVHSRKERIWPAQDLALFNTFVGLAAVALENSRLYKEAEDKATALAGLNRELEAALRVKNKFLSTVSHELRSPLFVIMGYAQLIAEGTFGELSPEMVVAAQKINKQVVRLAALITNLLDISQLESGKIKLAPWPFDLREMLDQICESVPGLVEDKPVVFEAAYSGDFPLVVSDRDKLKQVLGHLLDNAVKFTDQGKIILRAEARESGVAICVEDTGIGIDPAHAEIIFDGFRQVDDEDNRRYDGMGLGLYLSQQWLDRLGATISVESNPGGGTRFVIWLPHRDLAAAAAQLHL